jgi:hypothetical protein
MSTTTSVDRRPGRLRSLALLALTVTTGLATGLGGVLVAESGASAAPSYGTLTAPSGTLPAANQCGTFTYRYSIAPPEDNWLLHTTVIDPRGNAVASYDAFGYGYSAGGTDTTRDFTLCRNNTAPGVFTVVGELSTDDGSGTTSSVTSYAVTPATFTLTDAPVAATPSKAKHKKKHPGKKKNRKKHRNRR